MMEAVPVVIPIEESGLYCRSEAAMNAIGLAFKAGRDDVLNSMVMAITNHDCTMIEAPFEANIVGRGRTFGNGQGMRIQVVEVAPRTGGPQRLYFFIHVLIV